MSQTIFPNILEFQVKTQGGITKAFQWNKLVDHKKKQGYIATRAGWILFSPGSPFLTWAPPHVSPTGHGGRHALFAHPRPPLPPPLSRRRRLHSSITRRQTLTHPSIPPSLRYVIRGIAACDEPVSRRRGGGARVWGPADRMIWPFSATSSEALHQSRGPYRVSSTHPPVGASFSGPPPPPYWTTRR